MIGPWRIHGHAIVSADDKIAAADGLTPPALRNQADWRRFQQALDRAAVTVLGRLGHQANPNVKGRNRLVLSSSVDGVERRADTWWWNPADVPLEAALRQAAPGGGIVAVPGGRRVFDLFLDLGFDAFHLARAAAVRLPDGKPMAGAEVKIRNEAGRFTISGEDIRVNNRRVKNKSLRTGDLIEIGDTTIVFDGGAAKTQMPKPSGEAGGTKDAGGGAPRSSRLRLRTPCRYGRPRERPSPFAPRK